jgi:hypothetical protein
MVFRIHPIQFAVVMVTAKRLMLALAIMDGPDKLAKFLCAIMLLQTIQLHALARVIALLLIVVNATKILPLASGTEHQTALCALQITPHQVVLLRNVISTHAAVMVLAMQI